MFSRHHNSVMPYLTTARTAGWMAPFTGIFIMVWKVMFRAGDMTFILGGQ